MNMIPLPDEDDETIEVFSSPCSAPPLEPVPEVPFYPQETPAEKTPAQETTTQEVPAEAPEPGDEEPAAAPVNGTPAQEFAIEEPVPVAAPDNENVVPLPVTQTDNGYKSFEKQAEDSFRMAFGGNPKAVDSIVSAAGEACQNVALAMRSSAEEWMTGLRGSIRGCSNSASSMRRTAWISCAPFPAHGPSVMQWMRRPPICAGSMTR